jgi:hypothetical protein
MVVRSKTYVGNVSISRIAGSNPSDDIDIRLLHWSCVVLVGDSVSGGWLFQRGPDGVCVCLIVGDLETSTTTRPRPELCLFRRRTKLEIFGHYTDLILQSDLVIMREILNTLI